MSKPVARVAFAVLISLVLIAASYMTVQGAWLRTGITQAHAVTGLQTNLNHYRSTTSELQSLQIQNQPENGPHQGGGCHSDNQPSNDG
jgi:hypothetical protein